jgi:hypothetical protein
MGLRKLIGSICDSEMILWGKGEMAIDKRKGLNKWCIDDNIQCYYTG